MPAPKPSAGSKPAMPVITKAAPTVRKIAHKKPTTPNATAATMTGTRGLTSFTIRHMIEIFDRRVWGARVSAPAASAPTHGASSASPTFAARCSARNANASSSICWPHSFAYAPLVPHSCSCDPLSATRPFASTKMRSASATDAKRCEIMMTVRLFASSWITPMMACSLSASTFDVASSNM